MRVFFYIVSLVLLLFSCESKNSPANESTKNIIYRDVPVPSTSNEDTLSEEHYENYCDWYRSYASYLSKESRVDSMVFAIQYMPTDFLAYKEDEAIPFDTLLEKRKDYENMEYFIFSFGDIEGNDVLKSKRFNKVEPLDLSMHFNFGMEQDFTMEDCYGKRKCLFYHLEQHGGIKPYYTATIAFNRVSEADTCDKTIIYKDRAFDKGIVRLTITKDKLQTIPRIKLKETSLLHTHENI